MAAKNGYIGRAPSDSSVIVARQQYTPSGITTDFTFESGYTVGLFEVYKNGLKQLEGSEFTATDGSTFKMLGGGVGVGTALQAIAYKAFNAATATSSVGIHSAGTPISTQASVLNFIGTGNTFAVSGSTVDISIAGGGGGSGVAATITVADESTDTTCFPVFVTDATGNVNPKSGSNLTFNSSSGALSATSFVGDVTGNVTGNINASSPTGVSTVGILTAYGTVTATTFSGNATTATTATTATNVTVADESSDTTCFPLFSTAATGNLAPKSGSNLTFNSGTGELSVTSASISGNLSIGGTLTYDDVTNVDSIGLITARTGVRVTEGGLLVTAGVSTLSSGLQVSGGTGVSNRIELGNSQEFTLQYNTSSTKGIITAASNPIDIQATTIKLLPNTGENGVIVNQNGAVDLYHDNALKLSTASIGATVTGSLLVGAGQSFGSIDGATAVYYGDGSNLTGIAAGISTAAKVISGIVTTLDLSSAQDHKQTVSGIVTFTCSGGTEGDSHTIRIINSGITNVGFSTYFLFPSGATPSIPTADGAISLISFTVNRVGAGAGVASTELLAGASVNFN